MLSVPQELFDLFPNWVTISDEDVLRVKKYFSPLVNKNEQDLRISISICWIVPNGFDCIIMNKDGDHIQTYIAMPDLELKEFNLAVSSSEYMCEETMKICPCCNGEQREEEFDENGECIVPVTFSTIHVPDFSGKKEEE